jgi:serine phosphatase RsbU (regulator of sigma subunit)
VAKSIPAYLRLFNEQVPPPGPAAEPVDLNEVCSAFERVTGWSLRNLTGDARAEDVEVLWSAPVEPGADGSPGHLRVGVAVVSGESTAPQTDLSAAADLAAAIARLWRELNQTREALRQREADLAAGVPVVPQSDAGRHLADRLERVLRGGAEAIGCDAASLYLLDEGTTELKLRASWGLPVGRLKSPARPLDRAAADLEALAGHAIVLEDAAAQQNWAAPEQFPAAVCVPVSSPTVPLGTLWLFCNRARPFSDQEVNVVEIVAGRIAADLEREMLMAEGMEGARLKQQLAAAERFEHNQRPQIAPLVDAWDVAGWTEQAGRLGGDFYDWFVRSDEQLALALGDCSAQGIEAALTASSLRAGLRSHAEYVTEPGKLLERINRSLWTSSAGDQSAGLFFAAADPATGRLRYASAGHLAAIVLSTRDCQAVLTPTVLLGLLPETNYETCERLLESGDALLIASEGVCEALEERGGRFGDKRFVELLLPHLGESAADLAGRVRDQLEACAPRGQYDRTILVAKRRRAGARRPR